MKKVLIVGVNGGMGLETAKLFQQKGYEIWGLDYIEQAKEPFIHYIQTDITNIDSIHQAYEQIKDLVDAFDAIIHMAGVYMMDSLLEITDERMMKAFYTNYFGIYRINKIFLPLLKKGSRIIITSSELAPLDPLPFNGLYSITKSTLEKYAFSLRMEASLLGIKVSLIRPGAVQTSLLNASLLELDDFCNHTQLYSESSKKFKKIVNSVEAKHVSPKKVAQKAFRAFTSKHPRYVYNLNRNIGLRILNFLPDKIQVTLIHHLLKQPSSRKKK